MRGDLVMAVIIRKAIISDAEQMANIHARSWEVAYAGIISQDAFTKNVVMPLMEQKRNCL